PSASEAATVRSKRTSSRGPSSPSISSASVTLPSKRSTRQGLPVPVEPTSTRPMLCGGEPDLERWHAPQKRRVEAGDRRRGLDAGEALGQAGEHDLGLQ